MKKVFVLLLVVTVVLVVAVALVLRAGGRPDEKKESLATVTRGELIVKVVETGTIDAVKSVEVKSRASGRLARLLVDEGDFVEKGQLIGVIDPRETQLRVEQDAAQLRGARSAAEK